MPLVNLLAAIQYSQGTVDVLFLAFLILLGTFMLLCILLGRQARSEDLYDNHKRTARYWRQREETESSVREAEEEGQPILPSFYRSPGSSAWMATDTPSSPVGGNCLACGATVVEETSACCPQCGAEHKRCPICQRYVAGGQDLLACAHCRTPGHANEMLAWVEQHETCPYCARQIDEKDLKLLEELPPARQRKRANTREPQPKRTPP